VPITGTFDLISSLFLTSSSYDEKNFSPVKYRRFINAYPGYSLNYRAFISSTNKNALLAL
jgi:hypothetical protein